jgi:hypothetical protein
MTPDYRRIHELEYELGFRDDPPPTQNLRSVESILKQTWTDEPGAIIYYDPEQGRPTYLSDYEKRIDLARQIVRRACNDL